MNASMYLCMNVLYIYYILSAIKVIIDYINAYFIY